MIDMNDTEPVKIHGDPVPHLHSLCIVGLGLMGASLAMALRGSVEHISAVTRREETAHVALDRAIVESATTDLAAGVAQADVIVLAAPVRTIIGQLNKLGPMLKPGAVVTDLGSTKTEIVQAMNRLPAEIYAIGSHPMCGKELSGLDAAEPDLYRGKRWILTRTERTDEASFELIRHMARTAGSVTLELDAARHDMLVAFASHLPYALSLALVSATEQASLNDPMVWQVTASGFRDTSRVAASDVTMMLDILLTNGDAVTNAIRDFQFNLDQFVALLERRDEPGLQAYLTAAAQARKMKRD
jgi:prephenate dehydrogenase